MKILRALLITIGLIMVVADVANGQAVLVAPGPYPYTPLTPMQTAVSITSSTALTIPSGATYAVVCVEGNNARYSTDGTTTPTATVGMVLLQNQCVSLSGATTLARFLAIQVAATATLDVSYFK